MPRRAELNPARFEVLHKLISGNRRETRIAGRIDSIPQNEFSPVDQKGSLGLQGRAKTYGFGL